MKKNQITFMFEIKTKRERKRNSERDTDVREVRQRKAKHTRRTTKTVSVVYFTISTPTTSSTACRKSTNSFLSSAFFHINNTTNSAHDAFLIKTFKDFAVNFQNNFF